MTLKSAAYTDEIEPWALTRQGYEKMMRAMQPGVSLLDFKVKAAGTTPEAILLFSDDDNLLDIAPNGTAVIPVSGFLTRRSYWSGDRASYEWIGKQVTAALDSPNVARIVLNVDSPGGQVSGNEDLSSMIFDARSEKPITAFVQGQAASAAYWIASSASEILVGRQSMLGSIGVIWSFMDWSKYDAKVGIEEINIVSSQSPNKDIDPATKSGREQIQATVDQLAGVFVSDVARNRGVSEETVISDFGQGWVLVGDAAVEVGLADGIESFDSVVQGSPEGGESTGTATLVSSEHGESNNMDSIKIVDITAAWLKENCAALVSELRSGFISTADHQSALSALSSEVTAKVHDEATEQERERVLGIQSAAKGMGLGTLVAELIGDPKVSLEGAKARLFEAVSAKRKGSLEALSGDEEELETPDPGTDEEAQATEDAALLASAANYAASVSSVMESPKAR